VVEAETPYFPCGKFSRRGGEDRLSRRQARELAGEAVDAGKARRHLDLSKRRALAVKQALVAQYNIAPDRLANDGSGAARPVESNDTLEGLARNRRVELVRQGKQGGNKAAAALF